jgi:hydrogenase expression/formation protein HypE
MEDKILLSHGSGGSAMHDLIRNLFYRFFNNRILREQSDSAMLPSPQGQLAFTTDSYVVDPLFFPGGDIGKLAISGTVNDLSVAGAIPHFISASFIIEEGLPMNILEKVVRSMAREAKKAKVTIVTGDTKVVPSGKCDKLFITTSGIGYIAPKNEHIHSGIKVNDGDMILVNGTIGDHGMAILNARESFRFSAQIRSDCASLNLLTKKIQDVSDRVKFMRDATRGGIAGVLSEIAQKKDIGIEIVESNIPVRNTVRGLSELLGFDPLFLANEGKLIVIVGEKDASRVLDAMRTERIGKGSTIIGKVTKDHPGKVVLFTRGGGKRLLGMPLGEQLPRIC